MPIRVRVVLLRVAERGREASGRAPGPALGISVGGRALPRVDYARDRRVRGAAS